MESTNPSQAASGVKVFTDPPDQVSRQEVSDTSPAGQASAKGYPDNEQGIADTRETADTEATEALNRFLDTCIWYQCAGREAHVAGMSVVQAMGDMVTDLGLGLGEGGIHSILTGSYAEGMPREICGDADIMVTCSVLPIVLCEFPPEDTTSHKPQKWYVVPENNPCQPAYIKLSMRGNNSDIGADEIKHSVVQVGKGQWLSSQRLMQQFGFEQHEIHGPALTSLIDDNDPSGGTSDCVLCLRCPTWPAADFLHRPRPHGIPSQSLIQSIAAAGCHVVATGHPDSEDRDLEWRWSFSVAEKVIIYDMDRAMAGAMYVLKVLKKHIWIKENMPEGICSYYFKTSCLFLNEGVPHTDKTSILALVRQALDWLIACYQNHCIPHYFLPAQNLIGHLRQETCREMAHTLIDMKSKLQLYVLCGLQKDPVIAEVVHTIQHSISLSPQSDDTEVKTSVFLTALLEQGNVGQVLEAASDRIRPGTDTYRQKKFKVDNIALKWINSAFPGNVFRARLPSELVKIPEDVFLPIIDNIDHIVKAEFVSLHVSILYRILGLMYLALSFIIPGPLSPDCNTSSEYKGPAQDDKTPSGDCTMEKDKTPSSGGASDTQKYSPLLSAKRKCLVKSEEFLHKGIPTVLDEGFNDKGLSGYVHLSLYYFLTQQWDEALTASKKTLNIMDEVDDLMVHFNGLPGIYVDTASKLGTFLLKQDETLYQCLAQSGVREVNFNPVPLAYYFQARLALRQGHIKVAEAALGKMTKLMKTLCEFYQRSTDILIKTVVCQLGVFLD